MAAPTPPDPQPQPHQSPLESSLDSAGASLGPPEWGPGLEVPAVPPSAWGQRGQIRVREGCLKLSEDLACRVLCSRDTIEEVHHTCLDTEEWTLGTHGQRRPILALEMRP